MTHCRHPVRIQLCAPYPSAARPYRCARTGEQLTPSCWRCTAPSSRPSSERYRTARRPSRRTFGPPTTAPCTPAVWRRRRQPARAPAAGSWVWGAFWLWNGVVSCRWWAVWRKEGRGCFIHERREDKRCDHLYETCANTRPTLRHLPPAPD